MQKHSKSGESIMSGLSTERSGEDMDRNGRLHRDTTILVADRNPRIRGFVERELREAGYRVLAVESVSRLRSWITPGRLPDLLILDPDMPDGGPENPIWPLLGRYPQLPVVFHCLSADIPSPMPWMARTVIVEKSADSIDLLKQQIALLLRKKYQE
jgi:DNA-binding NtrC family response regulator